MPGERTQEQGAGTLGFHAGCVTMTGSTSTTPSEKNMQTNAIKKGEATNQKEGVWQIRQATQPAKDGVLRCSKRNIGPVFQRWNMPHLIV